MAELKLVRWALGVTRKHNIKNEHVRGTVKNAKLGDKVTLVWTAKNAKLGHKGYVSMDT